MPYLVFRAMAAAVCVTTASMLVHSSHRRCVSKRLSDFHSLLLLRGLHHHNVARLIGLARRLLLLHGHHNCHSTLVLVSIASLFSELLNLNKEGVHLSLEVIGHVLVLLIHSDLIEGQLSL